MSQTNFNNLIRNGTYNYPAGRRYEVDGRAPGMTITICDRCGQTHLAACIGFQAQDLCLACAQIVLDQYQAEQAEIQTQLEYSRLRENLPPSTFKSIIGGRVIR
jgi:hypothetical protein